VSPSESPAQDPDKPEVADGLAPPISRQLWREWLVARKRKQDEEEAARRQEEEGVISGLWVDLHALRQ
jgi:hypothetical protein